MLHKNFSTDSSNLTENGLSKNYEFNVDVKYSEDIEFALNEFTDLCTYDVIVGESLDEMAIASNDRYNGYTTAWQDLNAFTKDSNRMQIEHLPIIFLIKNFFFLLYDGSFMIEDIKINIIVSLCINHIIQLII